MAVLKELARSVLGYAAELDAYTKEDLEDAKKLYGAMYLLMSQSQALIDLAERATSLLGVAPRGYIDAGKILATHGIFSEEDLANYTSIVKFRNILVYKYQIVKTEIIKDIVLKRKYKKAVELALKILRRFEEDP
ncbi:hypothetical protein Pogu_1885 [Pyrobaculum oguniense TE7]|uniref:DUF86 domain-containing protein n=1 Tax=Pyrobaculum oguniense (strain DSM 13380 / JCM 10595 / TE7) TaxID=698757 RepID=H6QAY9_PYROT|nr:hypothetical protein Pogu_1885 [Pyrobaculum oguniense TE7]